MINDAVYYLALFIIIYHDHYGQKSKHIHW